MSATSTDNLFNQLLRMGLDAGALCAQSAQVEIDRYDHWTNPAGLGMAFTTGMCGSSGAYTTPAGQTL